MARVDEGDDEGAAVVIAAAVVFLVDAVGWRETGLREGRTNEKCGPGERGSGNLLVTRYEARKFSGYDLRYLVFLSFPLLDSLRPSILIAGTGKAKMGSMHVILTLLSTSVMSPTIFIVPFSIRNSFLSLSSHF